MTSAPLSTSNATALGVRPGAPLAGAVTVSGSKNAALPLIATAATLMRPVRIENLPASTDVEVLVALLGTMGTHVDRPVGDSGTMIVTNTAGECSPERELAARIRVSYYLVPALLARVGLARLPWPGGCRIGDRGMELHLRIYEAFGDRVRADAQGYEVRRSGEGEISAVRHQLPFRSRGATIAAVLRATIGRRPLRLGNPNLSPETLTVLDVLRTTGWSVQATEALLSLDPAPTIASDVLLPTWRVPGDKIEAGTLACAVIATGGTARIDGVLERDVLPLVTKLLGMGIPVHMQGTALYVDGHGTKPTGRPVEALASLAPDGLDADFEPLLMALALGFPGAHRFADALNPGRHGNLIPELRKLGAAIEETSPTECRLTGPQRCTGTQVVATDIRTGAALVIAGLTARGVTTLTGLDQLRRGYTDLPGKLASLGADVFAVTP
ncbi:UDP-N-acetylglucosamine 1-carboxyvinyltransferase (plasmid) [Streptomyces sp. BI20]|uniref:UDP-N-acetylglucosamine 1-carboxyvinyltransferase n=1 Tax=Streptomyces sp. BI20 TaxID=3403460 RepID=UPI003C74F632